MKQDRLAEEGLRGVPSIWSLSPAGVIIKLSKVTLTDTSGR